MSGLTTAKTGQNEERLMIPVVQKMGAGHYSERTFDDGTGGASHETNYTWNGHAFQ
jgi:hypothetical protein